MTVGDGGVEVGEGMGMKKLLVTGGAGYIGRHVVKALGLRGFELLTYDNLSTGQAGSVLYGELVQGDLLDEKRLGAALQEFGPDAVVHLASCSVVPESGQNPLLYYINNVQGTLTLLSCMKKAGVRNLVFSSSAAVYGGGQEVPVAETAPLRPDNPYGRTKMMAELVLDDLCMAGELDYLSLRYFNAAGADGDGELGEERKEATHLITRCVRAAAGSLEGLEIYGTDYPTPDGTCIRDYIHVEDLAQLHLIALEYLERGGSGEVFNCGYGRGSSVLEVVEAARRVTGADFVVRCCERRTGDVPVLVADNRKIREKLGWVPRQGDLEAIIASAWQWEKRRASRG